MAKQTKTQRGSSKANSGKQTIRGKRLSPVVKPTKTAKEKATATSKKAAKLTGATLAHNTNRYAKWGHGKNDGATGETERRYILDAIVTAGKATLADAIALGDGLHGLARIARQCRLGRWSVKGFNPSTEKASVSTKVRHAMVAELKKLKSNTAIVQTIVVPHLCRKA